MCYCNELLQRSGYLDVRARCMPDEKSFQNCIMRIETIYWLIMNDYDIYKIIEKNDNIDCVKIKIMNDYNLSDKDFEKLKELY